MLPINARSISQSVSAVCDAIQATHNALPQIHGGPSVKKLLATASVLGLVQNAAGAVIPPAPQANAGFVVGTFSAGDVNYAVTTGDVYHYGESAVESWNRVSSDCGNLTTFTSPAKDNNATQWLATDSCKSGVSLYGSAVSSDPVQDCIVQSFLTRSHSALSGGWICNGPGAQLNAASGFKVTKGTALAAIALTAASFYLFA